MAKKRGRPSGQTKARTTAKPKKQLYAIIWFAVAIFLLFVVFIKGENIWKTMHEFMFRLFGITAYACPFLLGAIAIIYATDKRYPHANAKIIESIILVVLIGAFVNVCCTDSKHLIGDMFGANLESAWDISSKYDGGLLGGLIGFPIGLAFGKTGAIITLILLIFVFVMIITGTQLIAFLKAIIKPAKAVSEQATNAFAERMTKDAGKDGKKKELKVIKGFDVDMEVDEPEKTPRKKHTLNEMQQKLVESYSDEEIPTPTDEDEYIPDDDTDDIDEAIIAAREEAENNQPERITVDFQKETDAVASEISENADDMPIYKFPPC